MPVALADIQPKKAYVSILKRNLDPVAFATLSKWLEERPAPAKARGKK